MPQMDIRATSMLVLLVTTIISTGVAVPAYEPSKWNQAYKLFVWNVTGDQMDTPVLLRELPGTCSSEGFESEPEAAPVNSCFVKQQPNGTWSLWVKKPGDLRDDSNCYCYALDVHKGGFCLPGTSNGTDHLLSRGATCDLVRAAVVADGARLVSREQVLGGQPSVGHYIAMMVRNTSCNPYHCWQEDFHAVRKDKDGTWSHKLSIGPVGNRDLFGNIMYDPEKSVLHGHYKDFCGYFHVVPSSMTIGVNVPDQSLQEVVRELSHDGIHAVAQPLPYKPGVDGARDEHNKRLDEEDILLSRLEDANDTRGLSDAVSTLGRRKLTHASSNTQKNIEDMTTPQSTDLSASAQYDIQDVISPTSVNRRLLSKHSKSSKLSM